MSDNHRQTRSTTLEIRAKIAQIIWIVAAVCATFLVLGALLIALKANPDNSIRELVVGVADRIDGPFSRKDGLFTFDGSNAGIKNVLVNWGIAAIAYLAIGKLLQRIIRP